ncbi:histone-like nucleoid-structuring protein Lsr2 [Streptomyces sp. NPDC003247]|uniref:Lsr2 family DNA-binding protein n=1 Tax=Streptomyces sp. NPDC003247 TaxID=3364677 RepID=UPI0036985D8D
MFTDWTQALEAESLPLEPSTEQQLAAACRVTARNARDKDDLAHLLDALGVPADEDTLTALLPLLPDTATAGELVTTQAPSTNAYAAVAADMLNRGDNPDHVRATLGLSDTELADAVTKAEAEPAPETGIAPGRDGTPAQGADSPEPETSGMRKPAPGTEIETLLAWGEQHTAKAVQALAARARTALAELASRRDTEHAVTEAEGRVDRLERELARAREELRQARTGKTTTKAAVAVPALNGKLSKEQLAAIRTWARANGHQVADRGNPAKAVMDAYDAAHRTTNLAEAI